MGPEWVHLDPFWDPPDHLSGTLVDPRAPALRYYVLLVACTQMALEPFNGAHELTQSVMDPSGPSDEVLSRSRWGISDPRSRGSEGSGPLGTPEMDHFGTPPEMVPEGP